MKKHWITFVLAIAALNSGCVTNTEITIFTYETHHLPRVHVNHKPVSPAADEDITFTAVAEVDSESTIDKIVVQQMNAQNEFVANLDCELQANVATCVVSDARDGAFFYRAFVENTSGKRTYSPGTYEFRVGRPDPGVFSLTPLRVPLKPNAKVSNNYRVDVVLIRDASGPANSSLHLSFDDFLNDATGIINDGILADPVYRWRDHQLGFFVATQTGRTSSFYDGRDNACGQNPWAGTDELPEELAGMEVLGVLHRRSASGSGYPLTDTIDFRDCAGQFVPDDTIGTFSTKTGETKSNLIAKHEYGHAAFGLGDEYTEGQSRNVLPASLVTDPGSCCCACNQPALGGGGEGSAGTPTGCVSNFDVLCFPGPASINPSGLPSCEDNIIVDDAWVPLHCGATSEARCPPIESQCILESAWLGEPPVEDYRRANVFASDTDCQAGLEAAADHPGVENENKRLGECRQLCGTADNPCPCGKPEAWITDLIDETGDTDDAMANLDTTLPDHGGTCAWCVETSLCVRWQSSHINGYPPEDIWQTCHAPPKWTRHLDDLIDYLGCWLAGTCGRDQKGQRPDSPKKPVAP